MVESASPPTTRSARKPKGEGHARRAEILEAAERIFVECGYEGATIRKIAEEVGLSSTALYMHFRDKSEILAEICRSAFARLTAASAAIRSHDTPVEVRLREISAVYARFAFENPNAYRLIYLTRPEEAQAGAEAVARELGVDLFSHVSALAAEAHAQGKLKHDPEMTAQLLWSGVHGVVSLIITKPYFPWRDHEALVAAMLDALAEGLFKR